MAKQGREEKPKVLEKTVGRMMGGSTAQGDQSPEIVIGEEYGRTPHSKEADKFYEQMRGKRASLDAQLPSRQPLAPREYRDGREDAVPRADAGDPSHALVHVSAVKRRKSDAAQSIV